MSTLKVSNARFYTAVPGTPRPIGAEALKNPPVAWKEMGNTSLEQIIEITSEGGERTTLGSIQNRALRESISDRLESFGINLLDWVTEALKHYYGSNVKIAQDGAVEVPTHPVPTEAAFLVVLYDGERVAGFYAAKSSIFRSTDVAVPDTNSLVSLPIRVSAMSMEGSKSTITVIPPTPVTAAPSPAGK